MDKGLWQATIPRVAKSRTRLKGLNTHLTLEMNPRCVDSYIQISVLLSMRKALKQSHKMAECMNQ